MQPLIIDYSHRLKPGMDPKVFPTVEIPRDRIASIFDDTDPIEQRYVVRVFLRKTLSWRGWVWTGDGGGWSVTEDTVSNEDWERLKQQAPAHNSPFIRDFSKVQSAPEDYKVYWEEKIPEDSEDIFPEQA